MQQLTSTMFPTDFQVKPVWSFPLQRDGRWLPLFHLLIKHRYINVRTAPLAFFKIILRRLRCVSFDGAAPWTVRSFVNIFANRFVRFRSVGHARPRLGCRVSASVSRQTGKHYTQTVNENLPCISPKSRCIRSNAKFDNVRQTRACAPSLVCKISKRAANCFFKSFTSSRYLCPA